MTEGVTLHEEKNRITGLIERKIIEHRLEIFLADALAEILGGNLEQRLQLGVATSGYYVRNAKSPALGDIRQFLKQIG